MIDKTVKLPPYVQTTQRWYNLILINVYYLGLTAISQTLTPLVIPLLIQQFVGQARQATFYGNLRLWTLMVALLVQSLMGLLSDRSTVKFGRRRPFIFIGTILDLFVIILIGLSASLSGIQGYWVLFFLIILVMISTNTAHGAIQGFIPDLVPDKQKGLASGIKAIFEVPVPLILVAFTIGPLIAQGQLWPALFVLMAILLTTMILTMFVKEPVPEPKSQPINWQPFIRLVLMTAVFTAIILFSGFLVNIVSRLVQPDLGLINSMVILGIAGLIAISAAIGAGVWISVRIGVGSHADQSTNRSFQWWVINRLAFLVGSTNLASFAVFFLQGRLGFAQEEAAGPASIILLIVGVLILLTAIPSGWISDRLGYKPVLVASGISASVGALIILLSPTITMVYIGAIFVGIATGVFYTTNWALGTKIVPQEEAGRYLGISNLAGAGAGAVGAFIGGPAADYFTVSFPEAPGIGYVLLFAIYAILFLFSVFALKYIQND